MQKINFVTETSERQFKNPLTGRGNSKRIIAVNESGKKGCLPGETTPYAPLGGKKTLLEVLEILVWI